MDYPLQRITTDSYNQQLNLAFLQMIFNFITVTANNDRLTLDDLQLDPISLEGLENEVQFDVICRFIYNQSSSRNIISCSLICSHGIFDRNTVQTLTDRYSFLVQQLVASTTVTTASKPLCKLSMKSEEIQSISLHNDRLESNLFQNTITKLHIPNIKDNLIILSDDHGKVIFTSRYTCSEIIHEIRNWEKLREFFVENVHIDDIGNDVSRYIIDILKQLEPNYVTEFMVKLCMYRESYINDLLQQRTTIFLRN